MTINISLTTPQNGQRQVDLDTNLVFSLTSDSYALLLTDTLSQQGTLTILINGVPAIVNGVFQTYENTFSGSIVEPTRFLTLNNPVEFKLGETILIEDAYTSNSNVVESIDQQVIKLKNAIDDLEDGYVSSISRGFEGSIVYNNVNNLAATVTINPLADFKLNSVILITVEASDISGYKKRSTFTFRTRDTIPPQIFNFPPVISNSNLSFKIVDLLQNQVYPSWVTVFLEGQAAIQSGVFADAFVGSFTQRNNSELDVFVKPRRPYTHNQTIDATIQVTDAYDNLGYYNRRTLNKSLEPVVQLMSVNPIQESIINPLEATFNFHVRSDLPLQKRSVNVSFIVSDIVDVSTQTNEHPSIVQGQFVDVNGIFVDENLVPETGEIIIGRDTYLTINQPHAISYNQEIQARVFFQEVSPQRLDLTFFQNLTGAWFDTQEVKTLLVTINNKTWTLWFKVSTQTLPPSITNPIQIDLLAIDSCLQVTQKIRNVVESLFTETYVSTRFDTENNDAILSIEAKEADTNLSANTSNSGSLLIKDDGGIPLSSPFFEQIITYKTTSSRLGPQVDQFNPALNTIASPTNKVSFRILSLTENSPINLNTLNVSINSILAITDGVFSNSFTGMIELVRNSENHTAIVEIQTPTPYEVGSTVAVQVDIRDQADNLTIQESSFIIVNTNIPIITITPSSGVYNKLIRVNIDTDQPTQIYYTIDGTVPTPGKATTFVGTNPVTNIPVFSQGITQVKALAINAAGIQSAIITNIYDVNQFPPIVSIVSPTDQFRQDITTVSISYKIDLERGFLNKVEYSLNSGPLVDILNTLSESSVLVTGLTSGTNTIEIFATDSVGNVGSSKVQVIVNPSSINDFSLKYAPLVCPKFPPRALSVTNTFNDFIDTATVVIIGYGQREQTLVTFAVGDGTDGKPQSFNPALPTDGRHFELDSYPLVPGSLRIFLFREGREVELDPQDFVAQTDTGRFVLDHPLEFGETLRVTYISESDLNSPEIFTPQALSDLFSKHGQPSIDNTLSLAAQMAFENGAQRVLAVQPLSIQQDSTWSQTFKRLELEEGYWIVPVLNNQMWHYYPTIRATAFNHVQKVSNIQYRTERVVVGAQVSNLDNFNDPRMSLMHIDLDAPIQRLVQGEVQTLNGSFVAACVAGLSSSFGNIATPITNKNISGFTLKTRLKSPVIDLDQIVARGLTPIQAAASGAYIYRGRTTSLSGDPRKEEISVQRTIDFISKNLRRSLENTFKGESITNNLLSDMTEAANRFMTTQSCLKSFSVQKIVTDNREPRQINVAIDFTPLFGLNNISVSFTFSARL
jgi:hypothetical protein